MEKAWHQHLGSWEPFLSLDYVFVSFPILVMAFTNIMLQPIWSSKFQKYPKPDNAVKLPALFHLAERHCNVTVLSLQELDFINYPGLRRRYHEIIQL